MNTQNLLGLGIAIVSIILVAGIVVAILFYNQYHNITTKESPLCLTGSCANTSQGCGTIPFKVQQDGSLICKTSLFSGTTPNVSVSSNG